jgi:hypothetical protein
MYTGSEIPAGYVAQAIHGFVEELVVNDDPEYQVRKNIVNTHTMCLYINLLVLYTFGSYERL